MSTECRDNDSFTEFEGLCQNMAPELREVVLVAMADLFYQARGCAGA